MVTHAKAHTSFSAAYGWCLREVYHLWTAHLGTWVAQGAIYTAILWLVFSLVGGVFGTRTGGFSFLFTAVAIAIVRALFEPGITLTALNQYRGFHTSTSDLFHGVRYFSHVFGVKLVTTLLLLPLSYFVSAIIGFLEKLPQLIRSGQVGPFFLYLLIPVGIGLIAVGLMQTLFYPVTPIIVTEHVHAPTAVMRSLRFLRVHFGLIFLTGLTMILLTSALFLVLIAPGIYHPFYAWLGVFLTGTVAIIWALIMQAVVSEYTFWSIYEGGGEMPR